MSPTTSTSPAVSVGQMQIPVHDTTAGGHRPPAGAASWEEPHPGERLSFPSETTTGLSGRAAGAGVHHNAGGGCRGGMAAKGQSPYTKPGRQSLVRRQVRVRTRESQACGALAGSTPQDNSANKSVACPSPTEAIGKTTTVSTGTSTTITLTEVPKVPESAKPQLHVDTDLMSPRSPPVSQPTSPYVFTDVSNFLDADPHPDSIMEPPQIPTDGSLMTYGRAAPQEDLYGWDEELERHLSSGNDPVSARFRERDAVGGRHVKTSGPRRNLLRRVFHLNNASRSAVTSEPQRMANSPF